MPAHLRGSHSAAASPSRRSALSRGRQVREGGRSAGAQGGPRTAFQHRGGCAGAAVVLQLRCLVAGRRAAGSSARPPSAGRLGKLWVSVARVRGQRLSALGWGKGVRSCARVLPHHCPNAERVRGRGVGGRRPGDAGAGQQVSQLRGGREGLRAGVCVYVCVSPVPSPLPPGQKGGGR